MNKNSYKYFILKEKNLVIEILSGGFNLAEYIALKQLQFENPDYDPNFDLIIDIRHIEEPISENTIKEYTQSIKQVQHFSRIIKVAVITSTPLQVVGATMYKLFENKSIDFEIFSDFDYALRWFGIMEIDLKELYL